MAPPPVSRTLAGFLARTSWNDLPRTAIVDARRSILDWLGSALAGSHEPPARMVRTLIWLCSDAEGDAPFCEMP